MKNRIFAGVALGIIIIIMVLCAMNDDTETCDDALIETEESEVEEVIPTEVEIVAIEIEEVETIITELPSEDVVEFIPLDIPMDAEVQEYLKNKCDENSIDFALVLALINQESDFVVDVVSETNDYGLMQINKCVHKELSLAIGVTDFLNPYDNIDAGIYLLANLFDKYDNAELVLMSYHFGDNGANKLWKQGKYTSKYSQAILEKQLEFQKMIDEKEHGDE